MAVTAAQISELRKSTGAGMLAAGHQKAARLLLEGRLVAFPTETVYGLGANALNADAVALIYAVNPFGADHQSSADQYQVLDDILALQRGRIGDAGEDIMREQENRCDRSEHLREQQKERTPHEDARDQAQTDQAFPGSQDVD